MPHPRTELRTASADVLRSFATLELLFRSLKPKARFVSAVRTFTVPRDTSTACHCLLRVAKFENGVKFMQAKITTQLRNLN